MSRWSSISTTVTLAPSASYTHAISKPMIPPPITSSRPGIDDGESAPVESMIRSSSGSPGMVAAWDPAAMMRLSKVISRSPTASELAPVSFPSPWITSTSRRLARPTSPPVSLSTTDCFQSSSLGRSTLGLPKEMPWAAISSVSAITRAACSRALLGMHPTLRQTPPRRSWRSISAVRNPRSAARNAAV